ncbi:MAG: large conductance mechanosensitive channel protein MscL [Clostridia bacterium]|nr:large conductance mechanosensitive channel protein MscL [Clostridia bacterium]
MKKFLKEFKEFAMRGNVMDMAIGVIIGGAFGKIVTSLVNDVFMPVLTLITGGKSVANQFVALKAWPEDVPAAEQTIEKAQELGIATLNWGLFIQTIIDFLLVALCIFLVIKAINKASSLRKKEEEAPAAPTTKECPFCFSEVPIKATRCPHCTSELQYVPEK